MTAKEYLKQTFTIDNEIRTLIEMTEELEAKATKITTTLDANKVIVDHDPHGREETIVKMIDMKNNINEKIDKLVDLKLQIFEKVYKVDNSDYRMLLALRYIKLYSFEEIAVDMCKSYRHIIRMHGWALQEFEKVVNQAG